MTNKTYEMTEKTTNTSAFVNVNGHLSAKGERKTENKKKTVNCDIWWKILITVAVVGLLIFVVFKEVQDKKCSSLKEYHKVVTPKLKELTDQKDYENKPSCSEKSVKDSYASFTYFPSIGSKPYKTNGLEFSFGEITNKLELSYLTELPTTSSVHYYLNIDRCRIGGGLQLDKEPRIRGPLAFAANQECTAVYYFSTSKKSWVKYKSASRITCSRHGVQFCRKGARNGLQWMYSKPENKITALEFEYKVLATKLEHYHQNIRPIDTVDSSGFHYLLNMKSCQSTNLYEPGMTPLLFAVNHNCTMAYVFRNSKWQRQMKGEPLFCSWKNTHKVWCNNGTTIKSKASFQFTSLYDSKKVKVDGTQLTFDTLSQKLHSLVTQDKVIQLETIENADVMYYLNIQRCLNGGLLSIDESHQVRGPLYFAITNNCTKVHYFTSNEEIWRTYMSAVNISCN